VWKRLLCSLQAGRPLWIVVHVDAFAGNRWCRQADLRVFEPERHSSAQQQLTAAQQDGSSSSSSCRAHSTAAPPHPAASTSAPRLTPIACLHRCAHAPQSGHLHTILVVLSQNNGQQLLFLRPSTFLLLCLSSSSFLPLFLLHHLLSSCIERESVTFHRPAGLSPYSQLLLVAIPLLSP
jgi:hypothetical protein